MAKQRIKAGKKANQKRNVSAEDRAATKRFFTITGIVVVVLLVIIFVIFQQS